MILMYGAVNMCILYRNGVSGCLMGIVGLNPYGGAWDVFPDVEVLRKAVRAYTSAPVPMRWTLV